MAELFYLVPYSIHIPRSYFQYPPLPIQVVLNDGPMGNGKGLQSKANFLRRVEVNGKVDLVFFKKFFSPRRSPILIDGKNLYALLMPLF